VTKPGRNKPVSIPCAKPTVPALLLLSLACSTTNLTYTGRGPVYHEIASAVNVSDQGYADGNPGPYSFSDLSHDKTVTEPATFDVRYKAWNFFSNAEENVYTGPDGTVHLHRTTDQDRQMQTIEKAGIAAVKFWFWTRFFQALFEFLSDVTVEGIDTYGDVEKAQIEADKPIPEPEPIPDPAPAP
jgi:hypothetical protein